MDKSNNTTCPNNAAFRYTWPGRDESFICERCAGKLRAVVSAMGLPLQLIELSDEQSAVEKCRQSVKG